MESKEIKGQTASPGTYTGTARIIREGSDTSLFIEGEILIVSHSKADLSPLIQKAGAIITEEGGTMSHAAVISRELKKPCLVGVKGATLVFKDGDRLEVDATKGFVKAM